MFTINNAVLTHCRNGLVKKFCTKTAKNILNGLTDVNLKKPLGQPTCYTHPHLLGEGEVTPFIKKTEYQCRRQKLVEAIVRHAKQKECFDQNHVIIIPSASKQYMSDKIPYVFRQNSEFLYLTGCQEPDTCLVITTGGSTCEHHRTTLFTRERDDHAEIWDGPRTHPEDAPAFFGVDESLQMCELEKYLCSLGKSSCNGLYLWYDYTSSPPQKDVHSNVVKLLQDSTSKKCESPKSFIHKLRLFKSTAEVALMQKSCDIASRAIAETMAYSRPGIGENHLFAKVDYECRARGAEFLAYPPVVAGGSRATVIHYINNNQVICANELVLMDAGCEYHGYASDITRTWPVNGKFTDPQRVIYEIVLCVQEELIKLCCQLPTLDALFESMCYLLGKRLQEAHLLGIQPSNNYLMKAAYQLCPHHVSHYLGMDVHDTPTISRNIKIEPGMVITVEPGIYVSQKNKSLPKEFQGIGIRIEDDILVTVNGPIVLSRKCPKSVSEIENITCNGLSDRS